MTIAVRVKFKNQGHWSKSYTYRSHFIPEVGEKVIVPTSDWYSVGEVTEVIPDGYAFVSGVTYKDIIQKLVLL